MSDQSDHPEEAPLVNAIMRGDREALAQLFALHRDRLWQIVNFRMDTRLRQRLDADDVLQEAYFRATQRMDRFLHDASRSCFVWLRMIVTQTLMDLYRRHLKAQARDARRELSINARWDSASTSASLAAQIVGHLPTPSSAAMRLELAQQVDAALGEMNDVDREVLALRHYEQLTNREAALVLEISEQAASVRYVRALGKMKNLLANSSLAPPE